MPQLLLCTRAAFHDAAELLKPCTTNYGPRAYSF